MDQVLNKRKAACPQCRCCLRFFPCMYCCQPDELISKDELIDVMRAANKGKGHVNMSIVDEQLKQDRERLAGHKLKWKRRCTLGCFTCCCGWMVGGVISIILLALGPWTLHCNGQGMCGWEARVHARAVWTPENRLVLAGGADQEQNFDDVWSTDREGLDWRQLVDHASFGPRHGHAFIVDPANGDMFILGGDAGGVGGQPPLPLQDVWRSRDGRDWVAVTRAAPWLARKFLGAVVDEQGYLYIAGGLTGYGIGGLNDVWRSEDRGRTWSSVTKAATWTARHSFAFARLTAGTATGRFYIVGGDDGQRQHDVWSSDDKGNTWQLMTFTHLREQRFNVFEERAPWNPTADVQAAISAEGTLTLPGGSRDDEVGFTNEVWELPAPFYEDVTWYNRKQGDERVERDWKPLAWTKTETPQWVARKGHAVAMDGENTPYVLGGEGADGLIADMWSRRTSVDIRNLAVVAGRLSGMLR